MSSLTLSLLALAAFQSPPASDPEPALRRPEPARLELAQGRASLITNGERIELRRGESRKVLGQAHLELSGMSRIRIAWDDRASLELIGPCSIEWGPRTSKAASVIDLDFRMHELGEVELEVRRGTHHIELPNDWHMRVGRGAMRMIGRVDGPTELHLHAGAPVPVHWFGDRGRPRPPIWLEAGSTCGLAKPPASRPDTTATAPAWDAVSWPWRRTTEDPWQQEQRIAMTKRLRLRDHLDPWPAPPPLPTEQALGEVASIGTAPEDVGIIRIIREQGPKDIAADKSKVAHLRPGVDPPLLKADYQDFHWRGVRWNKLRWAGPVIVETNKGLIVSELKGGRLKVMLTAEADAGMWIFGPEGDIRIEPGAVAVYSSEGRLEGRFGRYHPEDRVEGRPIKMAPPLPGK
ncbi:MAG: hypothetical protein ACI841_002834 [Planctomycetota bacterium]|jgi:hypothetical protein